jgi:hypothetical protein
MLRVLNAECDQLMVMARMNVGALRCHVHLRRRRTGFSTMVGEQPWSNHPLVDLLDRTQQFIGPKGQTIVLGASLNVFDDLDWGALRLKQMFAAEIIRLETESHHPSAKKCVYNFASVPGDPIIGLRSKCPRHTCWRATQASHLDLKLPQNCATKKFRKLSLDSVFPFLV